MDFKSLKPYARQAMEKRVKAPANLPIRWLVAYQIMIITEGSATLFFNESPYELSRGDVVFIPPNEPHRYIIKENTVKLIVYFDTNYSELSRMRNISSSISPQSLPSHRKVYLQSNIYSDYNLPLIFKPDNFEEYIACWREIKESIAKNNSYVAEIRMNKLLNFIHAKLGLTKIKDKIDYCDAVKDYIDASYEKVITLEQICELFQINKFTISKKFKQRYKTSIICYYNSKRLEYAKSRLSLPDTSITKLSEYLNFTDVYTFSKFFKTHTGVSPRTYKSQLCKNE